MAKTQRMGVALVGLGMVAPTYAAALTDLVGEIFLTGVLSTTPARAAAFCTAYPRFNARTYPDINAIAKDPEVDFVILATPPNARTDLVNQLIAARKPILMEKPVARTVHEATTIVEACEAANLPLGIVLQHRARPVVADLRTLIAGSDLGPLRTVEVSIPWWRPQSYYDAPGRGTYARDGGGVLISQAIHTLDLMLSLTGAVAEVTAFTATSGFHQMEAEDFVSVGMRFACGAVGTLFATTASPPGRSESITLNYSHASARLEATALHLTWADGSTQTFGAASDTGAGADPMAFTHAWHQTVIADFRSALMSGHPPMVTGRTALGVHQLIAAIEASGRTGHRCKVDLSES